MAKAIFSSDVGFFKSFLDLYGYGKLSPARFEIFFSNFPMEWNRRMNFAIEATSMPGRSIATATYKIAGPKREMPYELLYSNELQMSFRVGEDMFEKLVFEDWMNRVAPYSNGFINYYDSFVANLTITQLDRADNKVMKVTLHEVYPKIITDLDLAGIKTDETHIISITLSYKDYSIDSYVPYVQEIKEKIDPTFKSRNPIYPGSKQQIDNQLGSTEYLKQFGL
jgi:hypothetical protein